MTPPTPVRATCVALVLSFSAALSACPEEPTTPQITGDAQVDSDVSQGDAAQGDGTSQDAAPDTAPDVPTVDTATPDAAVPDTVTTDVAPADVSEISDGQTTDEGGDMGFDSGVPDGAAGDSVGDGDGAASPDVPSDNGGDAQPPDDVQGDGSTTVDAMADADAAADVDPEVTADVVPDAAADVPANDCGNRECGLSPTGAFCGVCPMNELCNAAGQCVPPAGSDGSYCGSTAACPLVISDPSGGQVLNPNWPACANAQCASNFCLDGAGVIVSAAPVCSKPCTISADFVDNSTGASGSDGIEDPGAFSQCTGFADGPNGSDFKCASYSPPGSGAAIAYCTPGTGFAPCASSDDCPSGEMCALTFIGGTYNERCISAFTGGAWGDGVPGGQTCNESDPTEPLAFCEQGGVCFGYGCASFCDPGTGAGCDTTEWEPGTGCNTAAGTCLGSPSIPCSVDSDCSWLECSLVDQPIFSNGSYTGDFCFPKGCDTDADCGNGLYCRFGYSGDVDGSGLPVWDNYCLPEFEGGVGLGAECDMDPDDSIPGDTCASEDMCIGGYCSAICTGDQDCGTDQFCHLLEFTIEDLSTPGGQQGLPLDVCLTYPGSKTSCLSNSECPSGERCETYLYRNPSGVTVGDGPIFVDGLCVTATGAGATGANCFSGSDCAGGWCIGADAGANVPGFCSEVCSASADCPSVDAGNGQTLNGLCTNLFTGYGGDSREPRFRIYTSVCQFTEASAQDCGPSSGALGSCPSGESCGAFVIASGPNHPATPEYRCISNENPAGQPAPSLQLGQTCDPELETPGGETVEQCLSGLCFEDSSAGFCTQICDPTNDTCASDLGNPTAFCDEVVSVPRKGAFASNAGSWNACRLDENCSPCALHEGCPGDRVCVNLGADDDFLADFRCVPSCATGADCTDPEAASVCNTGADFFGTPAQGCFDPGTFAPVNFCNP